MINDSDIYKDERVVLYKGNCLDVLPMLDDNSIDAVVADYPFGFSNNNWDMPLVNFMDFAYATVDESVRIVKDNGSVFLMLGTNTSAEVAVYAKSKHLTLVNWIVWQFDLGYHPTTRFKSRSYHLLWFSKGNWTFNGNDVRIPHKTNDKRNNKNGAIPSDVWTDISEPRKNSGEYRGHKGQKPEKLLVRIVKAITNPGETVLDFCMGSGTTGIACMKTNRKFVGIEIDSACFDVARKCIINAQHE